MIFLTAQQVIATPASSFTQDDMIRAIPVEMKLFGRYFILRTQSSGKHAGILDDPRLLGALNQFSLRLNATLLIPEIKEVKQPTRAKSRNHTSTTAVGNYSIRIALHGFRRDKEAISKTLSSAGLFLQHPSAAEVLPEVEYDNPHYLLRPGAKMPTVDELSMESDSNTPWHKDLEDETRSSNLLRMFESAGADGGVLADLKATPSPRLRSVLMT